MRAALLLLLPLVIACRPPCMEAGYRRDARVTTEYQLVTTANGDRVERRGFGPERMTMHLYDAFQCTPNMAKSSDTFWIESAPECRLMARAASHLRDTGRRASHKFIQSEAHLVEGHPCALALDDGRRVEGTVRTGTMVIRPATVQVDLALNVPDGAFHLVQNGAWN